MLQAPRVLAPLIDPNVHSCGMVYPHGARELAQPERGVFLVGMKSYGRAPTFLALTGYEQVRSFAAAIAGDREATPSGPSWSCRRPGCAAAAGLDDTADQLEAAAGCCGLAQTLDVAAPSVGAPAATGER